MITYIVLGALAIGVIVALVFGAIARAGGADAVLDNIDVNYL